HHDREGEAVDGAVGARPEAGGEGDAGADPGALEWAGGAERHARGERGEGLGVALGEIGEETPADHAAFADEGESASDLVERAGGGRGPDEIEVVEQPVGGHDLDAASERARIDAGQRERTAGLVVLPERGDRLPKDPAADFLVLDPRQLEETSEKVFAARHAICAVRPGRARGTLQRAKFPSPEKAFDGLARRPSQDGGAWLARGLLV